MLTVNTTGCAHPDIRMRSRTALVALVGFGLLACACASRDLKQAYGYGNAPSYNSYSGGSYSGPNTVIVSGIIPPVNLGGSGSGYTTTTTMNTNCPPEITEVDPVQIITPCDIQDYTTTKCTPKNVPDKFQNVYGGGKLHPNDIDNINWHVNQYMGSTLQGQVGVPASVSTNCFKKPQPPTYNYMPAASPSYKAPQAAYSAQQAAGKKHHAKPRHLAATAPAPPKPTGVAAPMPTATANAAPSNFVFKAPAYGQPTTYQTTYAQPDLYNDPVMVYGDIPAPVCWTPPVYYSPPPSYTPTYYSPPPCGITYSDPMTGNYGTAGPYQGIVIQRPGASVNTYTSPSPSPQACWVAADFVQPVISKGDK